MKVGQTIDLLKSQIENWLIKPKHSVFWLLLDLSSPNAQFKHLKPNKETQNLAWQSETSRYSIIQRKKKIKNWHTFDLSKVTP